MLSAVIIGISLSFQPNSTRGARFFKMKALPRAVDSFGNFAGHNVFCRNAVSHNFHDDPENFGNSLSF